MSLANLEPLTPREVGNAWATISDPAMPNTTTCPSSRQRAMAQTCHGLQRHYDRQLSKHFQQLRQVISNRQCHVQALKQSPVKVVLPTTPTLPTVHQSTRPTTVRLLTPTQASSDDPPARWSCLQARELMRRE